MIGRMSVLYVMMSVSLFWPHDLPASALRMLSFLLHLCVMFLACGANVEWVSSVTPSIFGVLLSGRVRLFILMLGMCLFW